MSDHAPPPPPPTTDDGRTFAEVYGHDEVYMQRHHVSSVGIYFGISFPLGLIVVAAILMRSRRLRRVMAKPVGGPLKEAPLGGSKMGQMMKSIADGITTSTRGEVIFMGVLYGVFLLCFCMALAHPYYDYFIRSPSMAWMHKLNITVGLFAFFAMIWAMVPIPPDGPVSFLNIMPFERIVRHHRLGGYTSAALIILHWIFAIVDVGPGPSLSFEDQHYIHNGWGSVAGFFTILLVVTAIPPVRRLWYDLFYPLHVFSVWAVLVTTLLHLGLHMGHLEFVAILSPILVSYVVIYVIRAWGPRSEAVAATDWISRADGEYVMVEVKATSSCFVNPMAKREPGAYAFVSIPALGFMRRKPMSVCNAPSSPYVRILVKDQGVGKWTNKLRQLAVDQLSLEATDDRAARSEPGANDELTAVVQARTFTSVRSSSRTSALVNRHGKDQGLTQSTLIRNIPIFMRGPYGRLAVNLDDYDTMWMISGGAGLTPLMSVLLHVFDAHKAASLPRLKMVHFVWTTRKPEGLLWLDVLLGDCGLPDDRVPSPINEDDRARLIRGEEIKTASGCAVCLHLYVTGSGNTVNTPPHRSGRPEVESIMREKGVEKEDNALILACGPPALLDVCTSASRTLGTDIHKETFLW